MLLQENKAKLSLFWWCCLICVDERESREGLPAECSWSFDQSETWIHCLAGVRVVAGGNRALIGCWKIAQLCQREGVLNRVIIVLDQRGVLIKHVFIWLKRGEQSLPPLWCHLCLSSTFCILVIRSHVRRIAFDILNKQGRAPQVKLRYWFWISLSFSVFKGVSKTVTFNLG